LPVVLAPFATGAAYAWAQTGRFAWGWFAASLSSAALSQLGLNVFHDLIDIASGADSAARSDAASVASGSASIASGTVSRRAAGVLAVLLLIAGGGLLLFVSVARTFAVLICIAISFGLAVVAAVPPIRFGSRLPGSAEAAMLAGGLLHGAAAYAALTKRIDAGAVRAAIVPALLTTLALFQQSLLRHRADAAAGRPSTASVLGPERTVAVSAVFAAVTFAILIVQAARNVYPRGALLGAAGCVPLAFAYVRAIRSGRNIQNYVTLLGSALGASFVVSAALVVSLAVRGAVR
jgi:1,4-dihydroxy-2-naphthoate octaprenyltransferase